MRFGSSGAASDRDQVDINRVTSSVSSGDSTGVWLRSLPEAGDGRGGTTACSEWPQLSTKHVWDIFGTVPLLCLMLWVFLPGSGPVPWVIKTGPIKKGTQRRVVTSACPACKLFPCPGIPETVGKNPSPSLSPPREKKNHLCLVGKSAGTGMVFHQRKAEVVSRDGRGGRARGHSL